MDTKKIEERIQELEQDVYKFSNTKLPLIYRIKSNFKNMYVMTPIIVFFLLIILRPQFIYKEKYDSKGYLISKNISPAYFLITFLIAVLIIYAGIFINDYKKK